jgi:class 3 adenylate cyclase/tetratricopeptide (TPR) repeat protein
MKCQECGFDNREGAKFCLSCGQKFEVKCPQCGKGLPPAARFCDECGHDLQKPEEAPAIDYTQPHAYTPKHLTDKILTARSSIEGERKLVTVLFCDLANSMALAERLGPEPMHALINEFFGLSLSGVHRYEGTINQFLGDGFMALFGAPIAHEGHARRAVLAAVEIQRRLRERTSALARLSREGLAVRMGLNTGLVIVGAIGDDLRMDYTAVGDTTNVAARLQQAAAPGQIVTSEATHRLVAGYCTTRAHGELALKGKSDPIRTWEVIAVDEARTRIEVEAERGLTPFVGRERELELLSDCFAQAREGHGQVVFLAGEAGLGKSRLVLEFRRRLGTEATWLEGHALSFGQSMAYHPLIDLLRRNLRIEEDDAEAAIAEKIEGGVLRLGEEMRSILPYIRYLLAVDPGDPAVKTMDPQLRRSEIFDGLRRLMLRAAEVRPQVLVFEDLHWMDPATEAFLTFLADSIPASRVLCLLTYRPGYAHPFGDRTYHTRIALPTLSNEDTVQMAQAVLDTEHLPEELETLILRKAEGNPFFAEEVVKSLRELGAIRRVGERYELAKPLDEIVVPDTIQDVLMARIDRLEEAPKKTLQLASVIGREFTRRLVDRLADIRDRTETYLQELKAIELIYEKTLFPELAYMFKHALTQDVAYHSLLEQRRKELHRLIGLAIEELYADRLAEQCEVLGYHFAKGEEWAKALEYLVKSGEKAAAAFANQEALDYYARALVVCDVVGDSAHETAAEVAQRRGMINMTVGNLEDAVADFQRMAADARALADGHLEGMALAYRGWVHWQNSEFDAAEESLRTALTVGDDGFEDVRFFALVMLAQAFKTSNRHAEAAQARRAAEPLAPTVRHPFIQNWWNVIETAWPRWEGRFDDALAQMDRWGATAEGSVVAFIPNGWMEALARGDKGEYQQALAVLENLLATCDRIGEVFWRVRAVNTMGWVYGELQDHERAMDWNLRGLKDARAENFHTPEVESNARLNLGDNLLATGRLDDAETEFKTVEQLVHNLRPRDSLQLWRYLQHFFHSYGELLLRRGDYEKALSYANECLELAEESKSQKYVVKGRRLRGQALLAQGRLAAAEPEIAVALEVAQRVGNPPQLWKNHAALGDLRQAQGRSDEARREYDSAVRVIEEVAAGLSEPSLRDTFLGSAHVQEIREKAHTAGAKT